MVGVHRKQYPPPPKSPFHRCSQSQSPSHSPGGPPLDSCPLCPPPPPPPTMRAVRNLTTLTSDYPPHTHTPDPSDAITNFNLPTASITLTVTFATPMTPVAVPARNVPSDVHRNPTGFSRDQRAVVVPETEKERASLLFKDCISSSSHASLL